MFRPLAAFLAMTLAIGIAGAIRLDGQVPVEGPEFEGRRLVLPPDYREWVFLSAGLGMTYGPNAPAAGQPQNFTNVYVNPSSYRAFMQNGIWPDRTMFILEIRGSASEGSINRSGKFQTGIRAIEANVKDLRLPDGWAFFDFGRERTLADPLPHTADCYSCHAKNTAVERTFVQFYPTLMEVAQRMKTVKPDYDPRPAAH